MKLRTVWPEARDTNPLNTVCPAP